MNKPFIIETIQGLYVSGIDDRNSIQFTRNKSQALIFYKEDALYRFVSNSIFGAYCKVPLENPSNDSDNEQLNLF